MSKDLILYEGNTVDELRADFEAGIESYLAGCLTDGVEPRKPYSGTLYVLPLKQDCGVGTRSGNDNQRVYKAGFREPTQAGPSMKPIIVS